MQSNLSSKLQSRLHVGIIMDGNGRWATRRRLSRLRGHEAGVEAIRRVGGSGAKAGRGHADALCVLQRQLAPAEGGSLRADVAVAVLSRQRDRKPRPQRRSSYRDRPPRSPARRPRRGDRPRRSRDRQRRRPASAHRGRLLGPRCDPECRGQGRRHGSSHPRDHFPSSSPAKQGFATSTSSSGPAARSGCPTSCCGRAPTPNCISRNGCGRISMRKISRKRWRRSIGRERRFGGLQPASPELAGEAAMSSSPPEGHPLMRILLINVPHPAIGSRIADDHLPPLGPPAVGGH